MDETQEQILQQQDDNKYSGRSAYDLPEEFALIEQLNKKSSQTTTTETASEAEKPSKKSKTKTKKIRSKRFQAAKQQVDKQKKYQIEEAVQKVLDLSTEKFDTSIELHMVAKKDTLSGSVTLPHGTGKEKKVAIFSDEIMKQIEDKKIDFDVLVARPEDMPKLAKYAKVLGPKGLMPNPKNGTISKDPEKAASSLGGNTVQYKTEKKAPLIHITIGKKSFGLTKLSENLKSVITTIDARQLKAASIASSMGPGVKLLIETTATK